MQKLPTNHEPLLITESPTLSEELEWTRAFHFRANKLYFSQRFIDANAVNKIPLHRRKFIRHHQSWYHLVVIHIIIIIIIIISSFFHCSAAKPNFACCDRVMNVEREKSGLWWLGWLTNVSARIHPSIWFDKRNFFTHVQKIYFIEQDSVQQMWFFFHFLFAVCTIKSSTIFHITRSHTIWFIFFFGSNLVHILLYCIFVASTIHLLGYIF